MHIDFARPCCARQRGTNENTKGVVRQDPPEGSDLTAESHHAVAANVGQYEKSRRAALSSTARTHYDVYIGY
jgi:IS30 family transposase